MTHKNPSELFGWLEEYRSLQEKRKHRSLSQQEHYRHKELQNRLNTTFKGRKRPPFQTPTQQEASESIQTTPSSQANDSFDGLPGSWLRNASASPETKFHTEEHPTFQSKTREETPSFDETSSEELVSFELFPPESLK